VKKCFWLVSYPKSGNTWLRLIIGALFFTNDGKINNFEVLEKIPKFDILNNFEFVKNISIKDYNTIFLKQIYDERMFLTYFKYINEAQKIIDLKGSTFGFFKTHNARVKINDVFYTNEETSLGFIYLYRDPRDIIISYSKYLGQNFDETINFIINGQLRNPKKIGRLPEVILNWGDHYKSWKKFNNVPSLFIKYENILENPTKEIDKIIYFFEKNYKLKIKNRDIKIKNILETTNFNNLKIIEQNGSFNENSENNSSLFFRKGSSGQWHKYLTKEQINLIYNKFQIEMRELEYLFLDNK
jgi:hypothetical protein